MDIKTELRQFAQAVLGSSAWAWRMITADSDFYPAEPRHCHEAWELRIFLSADRKKIEMLDLVPPRLWHCRIDPDNSRLTYTMLVSENEIYARCLEYTFGLLKSPYAGHLLPLLPKLYESQGSAFTEFAGEFQLVLSLIYRSAEVWAGDYPEEKMDSFLRKLDSSYFDSELSIAQLAAESGYSPNYIQKVFRLKTGMTPREYLIRVRMTKAAQLLTEGDYSIKEIASLCGFSSRQYFANAFLRCCGCAPGAFRKRVNGHLPDAKGP